jgi:GT2 family glycosyltransferase
LYYQSEAEIIHVGGGSTKKIYKQFSTLMKSQSIEQLIEKYYGKKGKIINRIGVFTASSLRLIAVYCIVVFFKFLKKEVWLFSETKKKHETMVLWSLNLKKARIGK